MLFDALSVEGVYLVETPMKRPPPMTSGALCMFYRTSQGCREGDLCPWVHEKGFTKQSNAKKRRMRAKKASTLLQESVASFDVGRDTDDFDGACGCVLEPFLEGVDLSELQKIARNNAGSYISNESTLPGRVGQLPCSVLTDLDQGPDNVSTNTNSEDLDTMHIEVVRSAAESVDMSDSSIFPHTVKAKIKKSKQKKKKKSRKKNKQKKSKEEGRCQTSIPEIRRLREELVIPDEVDESSHLLVLVLIYVDAGNKGAFADKERKKLNQRALELCQITPDTVGADAPINSINSFLPSIIHQVPFLLLQNSVNTKLETELVTVIQQVPWLSIGWETLCSFVSEYARQKPCVGVRNRILIVLAHETCGPVVHRSNKQILGEFVFNKETNKVENVFAVKCCSVVDRGYIRCSSCTVLTTHLRNKLKYRSRASYDDHKHRPLAPKVASLLIQQLEQRVVKLKEKLKAAKPPAAEDYSPFRVTLPLPSESELVKLATQVIENKLLTPDMFLYKLIYQQFVVLSADTSRGIKWDPAIIAWFQSLKYAGGKRVIGLLRGDTGRSRRGKSKMDPSTTCILGPSNATLKNHHAFFSAYEKLSEDMASVIAKISLAHDRGLLLFDEIEIRAGLEFSKDTSEIVGLAESAIAVSQVDTVVEADLPRLMARYIFQVFYVSLDGAVCLPLCFYPTVKADADWTYTTIEQIKNTLMTKGITIVGTSSDGWAGSVQFGNEIAKENLWHVDDFVHALKRMRNSLLEKVHVTKSCKTGFSMRTLYRIWCDHKEDFPELSAEVIRPTDLMNLECVLNLFQTIEPLRQIACKFSTDNKLVSECQALAGYFDTMKRYYNAWYGDGIDFETRLGSIDKANEYFQSTFKDEPKHSLSEESCRLLQITCNSLKNLKKLLTGEFLCNRISHLSTNIVENFFSQIRAKVRYPSVMDYAIAYAATVEEMFKRKMKNPFFPMPKKSKDKNYLSETQQGFDQKTLQMLFNQTSKKSAKLAEFQKANDGTEEQKRIAKDIVSRNRPNRRQLLVRELTCKSRAEQRRILECLVQDCPRMYYYAKALATHMKVAHFNEYDSSKVSLTHKSKPLEIDGFEEDDQHMVTEEIWNVFFLEVTIKEIAALHIATGGVFQRKYSDDTTKNQSFDSFVSWISKFGESRTLFVTQSPSNDPFQVFKAPPCVSWFFWSIAELAAPSNPPPVCEKFHEYEDAVRAIMNSTPNRTNTISNEEIESHLLLSYLETVQHRNVKISEAIDYSSWTAVQLKEELRKRNLPVSGKKELLISRLLGTQYTKTKTTKATKKSNQKRSSTVQKDPNKLKAYIWDIETNGLASKCDMTEIAAMEPSTSASYSSLIRLPAGAYIPSKISKITGITPDLLTKEGKPFSEAFQSLVEWVQSINTNNLEVLLVAHNSDTFDEKRLRAQIQRQHSSSVVLPPWQFFDSLKAVKVLVGSDSYCLDFLYHHFKITPGGHRAKSDCLALNQLLTSALQQTNQKYSVEEFLKSCYAQPETVNNKRIKRIIIPHTDVANWWKTNKPTESLPKEKPGSKTPTYSLPMSSKKIE